MTQHYITYPCITVMCFIIAIFTITGSLMYVNNCDTYFINQCISSPIICTITDHFIYDTYCSTNDDSYSYSYNCYELVIECIDLSDNACYADAGDYSSFIDAENYYQQNYEKNETMTAYMLDNNQTCSFTNPIPNYAESIFGFYSVVFSLIIFALLFAFIITYYIKMNKDSQYRPLSSLPRYTTESRYSIESRYSNDLEYISDLPPKYQ